MAPESINCIVTSPPYWALRDYQIKSIIWDGDENCEHDWNIKSHSTSPQSNKHTCGKIKGLEKNWEEGFCYKCKAWKGSLGLEPTFDLYIKHLCDIFDEIKRVLRKDGTCWVVIGDSYSGSGKAGKNPEYQNKHTEFSKPSIHSERFGMPTTECGIPHKSLVMIPFRFAIEMVNRGWILRNTIIWHKPNCMPASVKDRFTVDFEYVFFFVKNKDYYFKQQLEKYTKPIDRWGGPKMRKSSHKYIDIGEPKIGKMGATSMLREGRSVRPNEEGRNKRCIWRIKPENFEDEHFAVYPRELILTPIKSGCPPKGVIFDPFMGSGTTANVCKDLNIKCIGSEMNKKYCDMAIKRLQQEVLDFNW